MRVVDLRLGKMSSLMSQTNEGEHVSVPIEPLTKFEIDEAIKKIFKRCQTDLEFRKLCLTDPQSAFREITRKNLPEGYKIEFREAD